MAEDNLRIEISRLSPEEAVARILEHAMAMGASDVFLLAGEQDYMVQVRHLGTMRAISSMPLELGKRATSHLKARAGMDISEKRRPLDGRWIHTDKQRTVDLRINMIPTLYGEDYAIRLLERGTRLFVLDHLGMAVEQLSQYKSMIESPSGLVLVTGPTGSGKTSTLYASLMQLNDGTRKINTIEDPIEFSIDGLRQTQVNPAVELGFSDLLKSVLRQSPDVIMIGEIRDPETAQTAVRAANSGHLVFATLHAPTAAGAIQSMRAMDVHSHFLATALRAVVAQRLARTLCNACKEKYDLSMAPETFAEIRAYLRGDEGKFLYGSRGCPACRNLGYAGRTGVFEVLSITRELRNLIGEGAPTREIRAKAMEQRMFDFKQAALLQVAKGTTSTEEIFRVIPTEHLLEED